MPYNALLQITVLCIILQVKNKLQHACCMISLVTQVTFQWWWKDPDFSDSLANIHTREFSESRTTWQHTNWKMLGFADARRPMKALFALTVLFSEPSRSKVAAHYQERTRGFAVQIILEGRGDQQKLNKNQTICCGRCTWRSSESWSVPNTCENAYKTQKSIRVQTARLTMQCTRDNVWYYFALYKICVLLLVEPRSQCLGSSGKSARSVRSSHQEVESKWVKCKRALKMVRQVWRLTSSPKPRSWRFEGDGHVKASWSGWVLKCKGLWWFM